MKKFPVIAMSALLLVSVFSTEIKAESEVKVSPATTLPLESASAKTLISRLNEIDAIDKTGMASAEKKALRKEVRSIKRELNDLGGGVYMSVGAIIIILLLIIILV